MTRHLRRLLLLLVLAPLAFAAGRVSAHEMSMAELNLRETAAGEFLWSWGPTGRSRPIAEDLTPVWPAGCTGDSQSLHCPGGLSGSFSVEGVGKAYSAAIVTIHWRGGERRVYTLTAAEPKVMLRGGADDARPGIEVARAYAVLGVEHILGGIDHLLFVIGLLFLVGFRKRLVGTITAFTVAHSLTLAASALGWLALRSPPVEATIALSIVLVAGEALRDRETLARRWPALVACLFGLVHGLGFAGALKEIGLPDQHLLLALVTFNVGVEVGQLLAVGAAWAATAWLGRLAFFAAAKRPALYAIGSLAAYWSWLRIAAIAG